MAEATERARYDFKRALEELKDLSGRGTELVSLYVPPTRQISDVMAYLRNEYSQSSNIKSKSTKKNVMGAIDSIMSRLKVYKTPPENGVVFFVGHIPSGGDQTSMEAYVLEPPEPITTYMYRCDNRFYLEPLEDMLVDKKSYGLIVIDRNEATIGLLKGKSINLIKNIQSRVMGKHRQGGQSSVRFERLIEISVHEYMKKVGDLANEAFMAEEELQGVLVGGPGSTKRFFAEKEYLNHELKKKMVDLIDVGYTDESGLREMVQNAAGVLSEVDLMKEKNLVQRFLAEIRKSDGGLGTYGEAAVVSALQMGAVDTLLVSEALSKYRLHYVCGSCKSELDANAKTKSQAKRCPECNNNMSIEKAEDLVDVLYDMAESGSTKVALISGETEEGSMLLNAFGGIAAILRYKVGEYG
ncbi:MAG: peptide chain release factor aRF-1 [Candidatus Thermoplasmatota archaeon]|nr:peptide chain release factor aRF-1 [Candidatus Thermoplasmatota archaeon]